MVAVDLGAQSGRVALGTLDGDRLSVSVVHRFPNIPVQARGTLFWDPLRLFEEIQIGLTAASASSAEVASVGVDSWGVDYALLDADERLIENPVHHRDRRTDGAMEALFAEIPAREIYERTGIQLMPINTLVQLYAAAAAKEPALEIAETLLLIPDLFHLWLSGVATSEYTNATTTQFLDPRAQTWATELLERLGLPAKVLPELVRPATPLGALLPEVAERTRLRRAVVVARWIGARLPAHQRRRIRGQLDERGRDQRHRPLAQERQRDVARARVSTSVGRRGHRPRLRRARASRAERPLAHHPDRPG